MPFHLKEGPQGTGVSFDVQVNSARGNAVDGDGLRVQRMEHPIFLAVSHAALASLRFLVDDD